MIEAASVCCPRCKGIGHVPLDPALYACLESLRAGTPATSADIQARLKTRGYECRQTAVLNQLSRLCLLGLAIRRGKQGKWQLYRLPSERTPAA